jgi:hypothetical protein
MPFPELGIPTGNVVYGLRPGRGQKWLRTVARALTSLHPPNRCSLPSHCLQTPTEGLVRLRMNAMRRSGSPSERCNSCSPMARTRPSEACWRLRAVARSVALLRKNRGCIQPHTGNSEGLSILIRNLMQRKGPEGRQRTWKITYPWCRCRIWSWERLLEAAELCEAGAGKLTLIGLSKSKFAPSQPIATSSCTGVQVALTSDLTSTNIFTLS